MPVAVGLLSVAFGLAAHLTGWLALHAVYVRGTSCPNVDNFAYGVRWVALSVAVVLITPVLSFWLGRRMRASAWGSLASAAVLLALLAVPYYGFASWAFMLVCWD